MSGQHLKQECELCEPLFYNKAEAFHGADSVAVSVAQRALPFFGFGPGCSSLKCGSAKFSVIRDPNFYSCFDRNLPNLPVKTYDTCLGITILLLFVITVVCMPW